MTMEHDTKTRTDRMKKTPMVDLHILIPKHERDAIVKHVVSQRKKGVYPITISSVLREGAKMVIKV